MKILPAHPFLASLVLQGLNYVFGDTKEFGEDFDLEKEYQLILQKKSRYSANDREIIKRRYERIKNSEKENNENN